MSFGTTDMKNYILNGIKACRLLSLVALFFFSVGASAQDGTIDSSFLNSHYVQRLAFFKQMPPQKKEIVFLGNSITEGGEWQELIPGKHVLNRGISGDVTYGVLARLDEIVGSKPSKVFIMVGINDLKRGIPIDVILHNYSKIVGYIREKSPRSKVYIQSVLPINTYMLGESYKKITPDLIRELNRKLEHLAKEKHLTYLDVQSVFVNEQGLMKKEVTLDGIHLRSAAYILWVKYLRDVHAL